MTTALAVALQRAESLEAIPRMTEPGAWDQPDRSRIQVDNEFALMDTRTFKELHEYSASFPTGVYVGKMWKRHDGKFDPTCKPEDRRWLLVWFGHHANPKFVSNNFREILLTDGELPA